jgi:hypothetical protein
MANHFSSPHPPLNIYILRTTSTNCTTQNYSAAVVEPCASSSKKKKDAVFFLLTPTFSQSAIASNLQLATSLLTMNPAEFTIKEISSATAGVNFKEGMYCSTYKGVEVIKYLVQIL